MRAKLRGTLRLGAGGLILAAPLAGHTATFDLGPVNAQVDTTLSVGATFRMQDQDDSLIGITNGGTARSVNEDDGNYGFDKGDTVAAVAKITTDLDFSWGDYGLFSRLSYFADPIAEDADNINDRRGPIAPFVAGPTNLIAEARERGDYELGNRGHQRQDDEFSLLDLFAYGNWDVGGHSVSARFGRQVVNWGESTFIINGINSINPVDVARLRTPGSELKEALLPTSMFWGSVQLTNQLSLETVLMTQWQETQIDPRGSFFSTNDTASDDGDKIIVTFGRRKDENSVTTYPADVAALGVTGDPEAMVWLPREHDRKPDSDPDQYGAALRYYADNIGAEFGAYYLKYHSRTPIVSTVRGGLNGAGGSSPAPGNGTTNAINAPGGIAAAPLCSDDATAGDCRASYFIEYPENIELYGLSFNAGGPFGTALQGEYSYRPRQPLQLSGAELVMASLGLTNSVTGQDFITEGPYAGLPTAFLGVPAGTDIHGYERVEMHQITTTVTKAFGPSFGASQFVMLGDFGATYVDLPEELDFSAPGAALPAPGSGRATLATPEGFVAGGSVQSEGFLDNFSWGYRLVGRLDYEDMIGAVSLSPRLVWAHDVNGTGPTFNQGTKAITLGVGFNYLQRWQGDIGYTTFFGGRTYSGTDPIAAPEAQSQDFATSANPNKDRDFLAISVSYAF